MKSLNHTQPSAKGLPLFDGLDDAKPKKHRTAATSRAAFQQIRGQLPARALKALGYIRDQGDHGATDQELSDHFGWVYHGVAAVTGRILCRQHGLIVDRGQKRPNKSGAMARVWILKAQSKAS